MPSNAWNNTVAFVVDGEWFCVQDILDLEVVDFTRPSDVDGDYTPPLLTPRTIGEMLKLQRADKAKEAGG